MGIDVVGGLGRRVLSPAVAAVAGLGTVVLAPAVAEAALPRCTTVRSVNGTSPGSDDIVSIPTTSSGSRNCILRSGNRDNSSDSPIIELRYALNQCTTGDNIGVDGIYGTETKNLISLIQALHDLTADGVYGPATRKKLDWPSVGRHEGDRSCHRVS